MKQRGCRFSLALISLCDGNWVPITSPLAQGLIKP